MRAEIAQLAALADDPEMKALADEELAELRQRLPEAEHALQIAMLPRDSADLRPAMLEIRAGTGGDEAALFAGDRLELGVVAAGGDERLASGQLEGEAGFELGETVRDLGEALLGDGHAATATSHLGPSSRTCFRIHRATRTDGLGRETDPETSSG